MYEKFGEFDSVEELNKKAEELKAAGDEKELIELAKENGIDKEDAEDYMDDCTDELATPLMAAVGKIKAESEHLKLAGVLIDWKDTIMEMCTEDIRFQRAVRKKGKSMTGCMAKLMAFAFENKVQISEEIIKATKINHNGKVEQMRGLVYMGIPNKREVRQIVREYYEVEE